MDNMQMCWLSPETATIKDLLLEKPKNHQQIGKNILQKEKPPEVERKSRKFDLVVIIVSLTGEKNVIRRNTIEEMNLNGKVLRIDAIVMTGGTSAENIDPN